MDNPSEVVLSMDLRQGKGTSSALVVFKSSHRKQLKQLLKSLFRAQYEQQEAEVSKSSSMKKGKEPLLAAVGRSQPASTSTCSVSVSASRVPPSVNLASIPPTSDEDSVQSSLPCGQPPKELEMKTKQG